MMYQLMQFLMSDYDLGKSLLVGTMLSVIVLMLKVGFGAVIRWSLLICAALEIYLMSKSAACTRNTLFEMSSRYNGQCTDNWYGEYLNTNFGLNNWYVYVGYSIAFLILIWPLISHGRNGALAIKEAKEREDIEKALQAKYKLKDKSLSESIEKIRHM